MVVRKIVLVGLTLAAGLAMGQACGGPAPVANETSSQVVARPEYPKAIQVNTGYGCISRCIQYTTGGEWFCDSDCDGWFDDVEMANGGDPCNSYSPPFSPSLDNWSPVCSEILDYMKSTPEELQALSEAIRAEQMALLSSE